MRKKIKHNKKNEVIALKKERSIDWDKLLIGWHKYKGSHNKQRLTTNKPYFKKSTIID